MQFLVLNILFFVVSATYLALPLSIFYLISIRWDFKILLSSIHVIIGVVLAASIFSDFNRSTVFIALKIIEFAFLINFLIRLKGPGLSLQQLRKILYIYIAFIAITFCFVEFKLIHIQENIFGLLILPVAVLSGYYRLYTLLFLSGFLAFIFSSFSAFLAIVALFFLRSFSKILIRIVMLSTIMAAPLLIYSIKSNESLVFIPFAVNSIMPTMGIRIALWSAVYDALMKFNILELLFGGRTYFALGFMVSPEVISYSPFSFVGRDPHNLFFNIIATFGLAGILSYIFLIFRIKDFFFLYLLACYTIYWSAEPSLGSVQIYSISLCTLAFQMVKNRQLKLDIIRSNK